MKLLKAIANKLNGTGKAMKSRDVIIICVEVLGIVANFV